MTCPDLPLPSADPVPWRVKWVRRKEPVPPLLPPIVTQFAVDAKEKAMIDYGVGHDDIGIEAAKLRCGDVVRCEVLRGKFETWTVAYADYAANELAWSGWPNGRVAIDACAIVALATDAEHARTVALWLDHTWPCRFARPARPSALPPRGAPQTPPIRPPKAHRRVRGRDRAPASRGGGRRVMIPPDLQNGPVRSGKIVKRDFTDLVLVWNRNTLPYFFVAQGSPDVYVPCFTSEAKLRAFFEGVKTPVGDIAHIRNGKAFFRGLPKKFGDSPVRVVVDPTFVEGRHVRFLEVLWD